MRWILFVGLFVFVSSLYAEVPNEITYTGRLREYGKPTNAQRVMKFDIFPCATGGVPSWSSGNLTLLVSTGVFSATLRPTIDWRGKDFWIETTVSNKILAPREKLTAQAYAFHARTAEDVEKSAGNIHFAVGASTVGVLTADGRFGLGTTAPAQTLHVATGGIMFPDGSQMSSANIGSAESVGSNADATLSADGDANGSGRIVMKTAGAEHVSVSNSGNVGIGTASPAEKLDVAGNAKVSGSVSAAGGAVVITSDGKLGAGTASPQGPLHVVNVSENAIVMQECSNDAVGPGIISEKCRGTISNPQPVQQNDTLFQVRAKPYVNGDIRDMGTHIAVIADGSPSGNNVATRVSVFTASGNGTASERMTIKSDGKVGIGETNPTNTLVVNGSVTVNGSFNLLPPGLIMAYGGSSAPQGWLMCDGTAVSRTTYAALFAAIGTAFGSGDGSSTFNLPDFRGRFLRGRDGGVGRDPDRGTRGAMAAGGNTGDNVGSIQDDAFQGHIRVIVAEGYGDLYGSVGGSTSSFGIPYQLAVANSHQIMTGGYYSDGSNGTPRVSAETRSKNAAILYLIKY